MAMNDRSMRIAVGVIGLNLWLISSAVAVGPPYEQMALLQAPESDADAKATEESRDAWLAAREALRAEKFEDAAKRFADIIQKQPQSRYVPESYYWRAYALYELGGQARLKDASASLTEMMDRYPTHRSVEEAHELLIRIHGQLMNKHADRESAEKIIEFLEQWEESHPKDRSDRQSDCDPLKLAALQSLVQMNEARALPILKRVLEDHQKCDELREKAIFVLSQIESPEATQILLETARNDPDTQVRQQAVFWLSQVSGDESLAALREIAMDRTDREVQLKAIFALAQHSSPRAAATLEEIARNPAHSLEVREQAIFWLGQTDDSFDFLSGIYPTLEELELREKVLFSISQTGTRQAGSWLRERALDAKESQELRKKALFWLGQMGELSCKDMEKLYTEFTEREMKEQLIFGMSQMNESCATRALIEMARNEKDPELVEKIVFWLGQTGDDEALGFLEELINR